MLSVFSAINIFSEIRDGTKERMQEKREIDMTDEDREDFKNATSCFMWRSIQKVLTDSKKKLRNTKRPQATLLTNIKRFATVATLQVSVEDVLII